MLLLFFVLIYCCCFKKKKKVAAEQNRNLEPQNETHENINETKNELDGRRGHNEKKMRRSELEILSVE